MLNDFYQGSTKSFSGTIVYNGVNPDISLDTITFIMKSNKDDTDAQAVLETTGSVAESGSVGTYYFNLTPTQTDIAASSYFYEIN